jgi:hypothetical protein
VVWSTSWNLYTKQDAHVDQSTREDDACPASLYHALACMTVFDADDDFAMMVEECKIPNDPKQRQRYDTCSLCSMHSI